MLAIWGKRGSSTSDECRRTAGDWSGGTELKIEPLEIYAVYHDKYSLPWLR